MTLSPYLTYKPSGIDIIQQLPAHWTFEKLCRIASGDYKSFTDGDWIELPFITDSGVRLIQTGNIGIGEYKEQGFRYISEDTMQTLKCTEVQPGDILICRLAEPVGRACIAPNLGTKMITSVDVCILKPSADWDPRYVVYFLSSKPYLDALQAFSRGGTRDRVSRSFLGKIRIPKPDITEQQQIADFLDIRTSETKSLTAKYQRLVALLDDNRISLITRAVTRGLDPTCNMKDSGIDWVPRMPAHWKTLRNRVAFAERDERSVDGNEELLSVSHLTGVTPRSEKTVNMFMAESLEGYKICRRNDLAINTMWAWMGALGISRHDGIVSPSYNVYEIRSDELLPSYYDYLCRTPEHVFFIKSRSTGVWESRLRLYPGPFLDMRTCIPPLEEQEEIAEFLDSRLLALSTLADKARTAISLLSEHKSALITNVVTGQVDVASYESEPMEVSA